MKKILLSLLAIVSFTVSAQDTKSFTPKNWVTDNGNFYTPEQEVELNKIISDYEKKTSIEIGVLTVDSLGETSIEEYADQQFNRIGIGKKGADNGLLIVFSLKDRASRIETGNGMEPFFTDSDAYDALEVVKPSFRKGNYAEGTTNCINFITKKLGNEAFANKVLWLKQKKAKEAKEAAIAHAAFMSGLTDFLIVVGVIAILVFIYLLDRQRRRKIAAEKERIRLEELRVAKVKSDIIDNIRQIESITIAPVAFSNSRVLKINNEVVTKKLEEVLLDVKQSRSLTDDVYLSKLNTLKRDIKDKVSAYNSLNSNYVQDVSGISRLEGLVNDARYTNKKALSDLEKIKEYGYTKSYTDISQYLDSLSKECVLISNLVETDVDKAVANSKEFKENLSDALSISRGVSNYLLQIEESKTKVSSADTMVKNALKDVTSYKGYLKAGELEKIQKEYDTFKNKVSTSTDYLALAMGLMGLLASIASLVSTLRGRKSAEEEEERRKRRKKEEEEAAERRRRDSYYSSSSSSSSSWSSSSDSGSSFGGFGGGGSSGGGASSGW